MSLYKPPRERLERKLAAKRINLERLQEAYQAADNDRSRASFKGKITRCKKDIESLEARIKRLHG
jgi:predicted  nucleic acid-binding Zn-ribbon protein